MIDWERTALAWLLDLCPPEYRGYPELRRNPAVLARFGVLHVEASQAAVDRGLSEARVALRDIVGPAEMSAVIAVWEREKARLIGLRREVGLVEQALRGRRFVAHL